LQNNYTNWPLQLWCFTFRWNSIVLSLFIMQVTGGGYSHSSVKTSIASRLIECKADVITFYAVTCSCTIWLLILSSPNAPNRIIYK
jgi:hypothetical protein